ncbi:MAG: HipA N-terminal domain-containing protein [Bacteroidota bacterium]
MRKAEVYRNKVLAGYLIENDQGQYLFKYTDDYQKNLNRASISLTLPKTKSVHQSEYLFPFFYNMLSEGANRQLQTRHLRIDEKDYFGLLLATAQHDTIGAITVKKVEV